MSGSHGAHTNHDSNFVTENIDAAEVPVYASAELPETAYIPMVAVQSDPSHGVDMLALYHLPMSRVTPGGNFQTNTYSLNRGGATITVADNQVVPAYVTTTMPHIPVAANAGNAVTKARFLVLGADPNDANRVIIQSNGVYSFPISHSYIIGYQYYTSNTSGEVSTSPGTVSQKLFYVVDQKTIIINVEA